MSLLSNFELSNKFSDDFKINGKKCKKKGKNQTDPIKKGHNMDQGTCFQYYNSEIKNYIKSRI